MLEVFCTGCSKWFHANCLQDLKELYVFYIFPHWSIYLPIRLDRKKIWEKLAQQNFLKCPSLGAPPARNSNFEFPARNSFSTPRKFIIPSQLKSIRSKFGPEPSLILWEWIEIAVFDRHLGLTPLLPLNRNETTIFPKNEDFWYI